MRILMITPSLPSPLNRIRSLNLIKAFKHLGYQVFLFSLLIDERESLYLNQVKRLVDELEVVDYPFTQGIRKIINHVYYWPFYPWEYLFLKNSQLNKKLTSFIKRNKPDILYIKRLRTLAFCQDLIVNYPTIIDTTDAMSLFYKGLLDTPEIKRKIINYHEYFTYKELEKRVKKNLKGAALIVASQRDKEYLINQGFANVHVWPNVYQPGLKEKVTKTLKPTLAFSGLMDKEINYRPALEIINKLWPRIRRKLPRAEFWLIGPNPVKKLLTFNNKDGIVVWGYIPNLERILASVWLYLAWGQTPAGSRNKIIQAASLRLPVVISNQASQGLVFTSQDFQPSTSLSETEKVILKLLGDSKQRQVLADKMYKWWRKNYSLTHLEEVIKQDLKLWPR